MVETTSGILCSHALNPEADDKNDKEKRLSCGKKLAYWKTLLKSKYKWNFEFIQWSRFVTKKGSPKKERTGLSSGVNGAKQQKCLKSN